MCRASGVTRYVDVNCLTPVAPYTSWSQASTNIQVAIDASVAGDVIVVTNGIYNFGGKAVFGTMTNRVAINKQVAVRSINGPQFTIIQGRQLPGTNNGDGAIRCVYLRAGASLDGFTLTGGATRSAGDYANERSGGGIWCDTGNPLVTNCVITGNTATGNGGGSFYGTLINCTLLNNWTTGNGGGSSGGTLNNCVISSNSAALGGGVNSSTAPGDIFSAIVNNCIITGNTATDSGGGVNSGTINNSVLSGNTAFNQAGGAGGSLLRQCTVTHNSANYGGGLFGGSATNCILYFNAANRDSADQYFSSVAYCCIATPPDPIYRSPGIITADPQLAGSAHITAASPCRAAGLSGIILGTDTDGELWASPPSIGCDEFRSGSITGALSASMLAAYSNVAVGFSVDLNAVINGHASVSAWNFGDGTVLTNHPWTSHAWSAPGDYPVVLWTANETFPSGVMATTIVHVVDAPIHYVSPASLTPVSPYNSWATAATNIQLAVDAATLPGALVLVTNGTYAIGGRAVYGTMTNRLAVTKPVTVKSVNGPSVTIISGAQIPNSTNGPTAIRCVYLTNGACLSGFTLTNGATHSTGDRDRELNGGALWCESSSALATNCVLIGNVSAQNGGAASYGAMDHCAFIANVARTNGGAVYNSSLSFCTIQFNSAGSDGGGVAGGSVYNSIIQSNSAQYYGGGAYNAFVNNSFLTANTVVNYGGGSYGGTLNNCTITANSSLQFAGGTYNGGLNNCIIYFNSAPSIDNASAFFLNYCCTTPLPNAGVGNIGVNPQLVGGAHLGVTSSCRLAGSAAYATRTDIDGNPWASPPSIGCDEPAVGPAVGALSVSITAPLTNVATGWPLALTGNISGWATVSAWDFSDGTVVTNEPFASHAWTSAGDYIVSFRAWNDSNPGGVSASLLVHVVSAPVHYVADGNPAAAAPFLTWATAAPDIQSAIDVAEAGALILVTNGVYSTGGRAVFGIMTNRVAVTKPVLVQSVNGPALTAIQGYQVATTNGDGAIRCVYLAAGAVLNGFTLTNGATRASNGPYPEVSGGGAWCESASAILTNCILTGNAACAYGGGIVGGTLNNCILIGNRATGIQFLSGSGGGAEASRLNSCLLTANSAGYGAGADASTLNDCTVLSNPGGGVYASTVNRCVIAGNSGNSGAGAWGGTLNQCILSNNAATYYGGGAYGSTVSNSLLMANSASMGGGAHSATLQNCTVAANSATLGGGVYSSTLANSIVYQNTATNSGPNYYIGSAFQYCCTTPDPGSGLFNITNNPLFLNSSVGDFHLQPNSPCINAGRNDYAPQMSDLDGYPRIFSGTVDIGAYESQLSGSLISYAWLQQYGLPTDGSADALDPDGDGMNNWQEWIAGTVPTNAASVLKMLSPSKNPSGLQLMWQSVTGKTYFLQRSTNLAVQPAFLTIQSNLFGQTNTTAFTDSGATNQTPYFYRVGVQ